jgi:hypothetical protein
VFLLFLLGDTVLLQQPLPFLGQTGELAGLIIISHMRYMHRILRGRNLDVARRTEHAVNETGEAGFFASSRPRRGWGRAAIIDLIGIALIVVRSLRLPMRKGVHHPVRKGREAGRLSESLAAARIVGTGVMGAQYRRLWVRLIMLGQMIGFGAILI